MNISNGGARIGQRPRPALCYSATVRYRHGGFLGHTPGCLGPDAASEYLGQHSADPLINDWYVEFGNVRISIN